MNIYTTITCLKNCSPIAVFVAGLLGIFIATGQTESYAQDKAVLTTGHCSICHEMAPADIEAAGAKHKTEIVCMDCHGGHPPKALEIIPQCSDCHGGEPHYDLDRCLECHKNPHRPLEIKIPKDTTDPCLTCHNSQIEQLRTQTTKHSELSCSSCHQQHGAVPGCIECHQPHSNTMAAETCTKCHQAHQPAPVVYGSNISSESCAACHDGIMETIKANPAKHRELLCVSCHKENHGAIPACSDCHQKVHWKGLMEKYPNCLDCHGDPHDLPQTE